MGVLAWIVGLILAAGFAMSGLGKVQGLAMMNETRERLKVAPGLWKTIGGLEAAGAVGLVVGLISDSAQWLGLLAAAGLIVTMIGAVIHHSRAGDPPKEMIPAAMMMVLSVLYIIFLAAS